MKSSMIGALLFVLYMGPGIRNLRERVGGDKDTHEESP